MAMDNFMPHYGFLTSSLVSQQRPAQVREDITSVDGWMDGWDGWMEWDGMTWMDWRTDWLDSS